MPLIKMSLHQLKINGTSDLDLINTWFVLMTHIDKQVWFYSTYIKGTSNTFNLLKSIEKELHVSTNIEGCPFDFENLEEGLQTVEDGINLCSSSVSNYGK